MTDTLTGGGIAFRHTELMPQVLDALRALGGSAKPKSVYEWITHQRSLTPDERNLQDSSGQNQFENRTRFARFYLAHAGLIDSSVRGEWTLSDRGRATHLTEEQAERLAKEITPKLRRTPGTSVAADSEPRAPEPVSEVCWFVGAQWSGYDDQVPRFLADGIWENGESGTEREADLVRSMQVGERIAIKAAYVRKHGLPFDNAGRTTSVMAIKATGVITGNPGDGRRVQVDWTPLPKPREWYFYTFQPTIWRVAPDKPEKVALIRFAFGGEEQDFEFWAPAWRREPETGDDTPAVEDQLPDQTIALPSYDLDSILADGCFLARDQLENALALLRRKKNLVLQGPPGTGKTWLAKRLGYALIGAKDPSRMTAMQFQPSLSYEDFVRGWRPTGEAGQVGLKLTDGLFLQMIERAKGRPGEPVVLVIEEVNRGNPAQIFGELLTLLEADKRNAGEALRLAYPRPDLADERVHIPENLYVIGTMNLADRSLALVDLALRRRFAFLSLQPELGPAWRAWCVTRGAPEPLLDEIAARLMALNAAIAADKRLGEQFRVGHSFVTPPEALSGEPESGWRAWYDAVITAEIGPLLDEYWYDDLEAARREKARLRLA